MHTYIIQDRLTGETLFASDLVSEIQKQFSVFKRKKQNVEIVRITKNQKIKPGYLRACKDGNFGIRQKETAQGEWAIRMSIDLFFSLFLRENPGDHIGLGRLHDLYSAWLGLEYKGFEIPEISKFEDIINERYETHLSCLMDHTCISS